MPGMPWEAGAEFLPDELTAQIRRAIASKDWPTVWRLLPTDRYNVYIDEDAIGEFIGVRTRQPGDRIEPLGMAHEKKVKDIMVDRHIPRADVDACRFFLPGRAVSG